MQGAQVRSLVRELRFRMLHGAAKKQTNKQKNMQEVNGIRDL